MKAFLVGRLVYLSYLAALLRPGHPPIQLNADQTVQGTTDHWSADELKLLVEEGRRQHDALITEIASTRSRAQYAFTLAVALVAALVAQLNAAQENEVDGEQLLYAVLILTMVGLLGCLSLMVVQVGISSVHAGVLSGWDPPVLQKLASDYSESVIYTGKTSKTMLTVYRESVLYVSLGAALNALYWLIYRI